MIILLGINSWGLNQNAKTNSSIQLTFGLLIFAFSGICVCLALQNLKGIGALRIFAYLSPLVLVENNLHSTNIATFTLLIVDVISLLILFLPSTIDILTRDIGAENEKIFTLQTPAGVAITTVLVWSFFWLTVFYFIINIRNSNWIISSILFAHCFIVLIIDNKFG